MRKAADRDGYTLVELVVALLLFAIGGLALTSTSAVIGRQLNSNTVRDQAGRIATSRLEILRAQCRAASTGSETLQRIRSEWTVSFPDPARVSLVESVTYETWSGRRTDIYRATAPCER
jgi:prepilin-type N-terminal cleavage/methylation domain-containing protein